MKKTNYDVIVIGGGAAGMLASAIAAERGFSTLLVEHNSQNGRKLRITGKGRCNLTNNCSAAEVIQNIPTGGKFLYSVMNNFPPSKTMETFTAMGVMLKTERGNRVFPVSDKASDVVAALNSKMKHAGVSEKCTHVDRLLFSEGQIDGVETGEGAFYAPRVILATGGLSYPGTGSDGSGYQLAASVGHSIITPSASLVPLESDDPDCAEMQGLSLKNIKLTVTNGNKKPIFEDFGEMLFTHFGVSGPLVLSASAHMQDYAHSKYILLLDLKPALTTEKLDARLLREFTEQPNRDFINCAATLVHKKMVPVLIKRCGIPPHQKSNTITKEQRRTLLETLKHFAISVSGPRPISEAIITSGGIDCKEINPKTMESKKMKGLYFAGEIINCDGYTGGFNLQIAWATAYAAAMHLEKSDIYDN